MDELEHRLQQQPIRAIPDGWRKDIMRAAKEARCGGEPGSSRGSVPLWNVLRPAVLSLAASLVLLLSAHGVANRLADRDGGTGAGSVSVTRWTDGETIAVGLLASVSVSPPVDGDVLRRWRDRMRLESICQGNGG